MSAYLLQGDMLETLKQLPDNSIDSCVTDPPYNLESIAKRFGAKNAAPAKPGIDGLFQRTSRGWMGSEWDTDIAFYPETWEAVLRVLKPGAYIVAFSSARTYGRMQVALEDAGFRTHPMIGWVQSQGMPLGAKSLGIPGTEHLRYGNALKPSLEPIYVGQKPAEGSGRANYEKWGTGCVDIGSLRVGDEVRHAAYTSLAPCYGNSFSAAGTQEARRGTQGEEKEYVGRYPGNLWHDNSPEVLALFPDSKGQLAPAKNDGSAQGNKAYGALKHVNSTTEPRGDDGSAARFFPSCPYEAGETDAFYYHPKANKKDKEGTAHSTVKPKSLMAKLIKGWTPPNGTVLDCFAGSGSTGVAALAEGFNAVLCEREAEYCRDIQRRIPGIKVFAKKAAA